MGPVQSAELVAEPDFRLDRIWDVTELRLFKFLGASQTFHKLKTTNEMLVFYHDSRLQGIHIGLDCSWTSWGEGE
jgi:hypothetical protein